MIRFPGPFLFTLTWHASYGQCPERNSILQMWSGCIKYTELPPLFCTQVFVNAISVCIIPFSHNGLMIHAHTHTHTHAHTNAHIAFATAVHLICLKSGPYFVSITFNSIKFGSYSFTLQLEEETVKHLSTVRETWFRSLGWEDPLEKEMASHSRTIAWKIPWTEEPGMLQSMGLQRVGHD